MSLLVQLAHPPYLRAPLYPLTLPFWSPFLYVSFLFLFSPSPVRRVFTCRPSSGASVRWPSVRSALRRSSPRRTSFFLRVPAPSARCMRSCVTFFLYDSAPYTHLIDSPRSSRRMYGYVASNGQLYRICVHRPRPCPCLSACFPAGSGRRSWSSMFFYLSHGRVFDAHKG